MEEVFRDDANIDRFVDVLGATIRYRAVEDDGLPLIFLHGNGLTLEYWDGLMAALEGRHRISLDLIGHGKSDRPRVDYDKVTHERYLLGFLDALGIDRAVVVGHSLGGIMALWTGFSSPGRIAAIAALQTPDTVNAIAFDPARAAVMKPGLLNAVAKAISETSLAKSALRRRHLRQNLGFMSSVFGAEFSDVLPRIAQPTLISNSPGDSIVAYSSRETYLGLLPNAVAIDLPIDADHHAPRERPKETAAVLCEFLDRVDPVTHTCHPSSVDRRERTPA
jgi:pimeloyl-ACP methyl ester carboxylesterase